MLRNRPDVRQAELLAMSQNALIGLAKADLYPSFSLVGSIGVAAGGGRVTATSMTCSIPMQLPTPSDRPSYGRF